MYLLCEELGDFVGGLSRHGARDRIFDLVAVKVVKVAKPTILKNFPFDVIGLLHDWVHRSQTNQLTAYGMPTKFYQHVWQMPAYFVDKDSTQLTNCLIKNKQKSTTAFRFVSSQPELLISKKESHETSHLCSFKRQMKKKWCKISQTIKLYRLIDIS